MPGVGLWVALVLCGLFACGALWWRRAVVAALVLAVFEGALRKWVFPEAQQWVYLAKDVLLLGAYAGFLLDRTRSGALRGLRHPVTPVLVALGLFGLAQVANPRLPNTWVGLFGLKAYLVYAPLLYLVPAVFRDGTALRRFWAAYLGLALVPLLLGPVQFQLPPDHVVNRYAWADEMGPGVAALPSGLRPRVTGTFSYISGYTAYLTVLALVAIALATPARGSRSRFWAWALLTLAVANLFMTGSRGPFLLLAGAVLVLLVIAGRIAGPRAPLLAVGLAGGLAAASFVAGGAFPDAYREFVTRVTATTDLPGRIMGVVTGPLWALGEAPPLGFGIGSTHQATAYLAPDGWASAPPPAEGELERIILELGPFGFGLVMLVRAVVTAALWRKLQAARGTSLEPFAVSAFLFSVVALPGPIVFNHTAGLFYWFLAGVALIPATDVAEGARPAATAGEERPVRVVA